MITRMRMGLLAPLLVCLMTACGGGGGSNNTPTPPPTGNPPPTPTPTAEDTDNARNSQLAVTLKAETNEVVIAWTDSFPSEAGYKIESRPTAGSEWQTVESLAATASVGTPYQWQRVIDSSRIYRISATRDGYSVPLQTPTGHSEIAVQVNQAMSLQLDQTDPVHGTVRVSVQGANPVEIINVTYYVDLAQLATENGAPTYATNWDTSSYTKGEHLLLARAQQTSGVFTELRRTVVVDNSALAGSLTFRSLGTSEEPTLNLRVQASSEPGIQSVEFFANGNSVATVTTRTWDGVYETFLSQLDLPSGPNNFMARVTDNAGAQIELNEQYIVNHPPILSLTSPFDGAIVSGTLALRGSFTDDNNNAELTVHLRDVEIYRSSTAGAFSLDYPLTSLAGQYSLRVVVRDLDRAVSRDLAIVISSTGLTYELMATGVTKILDSDGAAVLYQKYPNTFVRRSAAGVETTLLQVPAGEQSPHTWQFDGGHVVALGTAPNEQYNTHVYHFDGAGQRTDISGSLGQADTGRSLLLRAPWLIWEQSSAGISIYNLDTQAHVTAPLTQGLDSVTDLDFVTTPGNEQLLFSATNIFRYTLADGATEQLTAGDATHSDVKTDNTRLAWAKNDQPGTGVPTAIAVAPVANPTATTEYPTRKNSFDLEDGVLAWAEGPWVPGYPPYTIKVDDGTVTAISSSASEGPHASAGRVVFTESGKVYVWSRTGGKQVLLDAMPPWTIRVKDGWAFFMLGSDEDNYVAYRVQLP